MMGSSPTQRPWQPGFIARFPYTGFLSLLAVVLCIAGAGIVLFISNNQPTSQWTWQPNVYLTIFSTIANAILIVAHGEAASIAWWLTLLRVKTTIKDLHQVWLNGSSFWAALLSGRKFDLLALSCILVALTPINGPLLQRSSITSVETLHTKVPVSLQMNNHLPTTYWTGYLDPGDLTYQLSFLNPNFTEIFNDYNRGTTIRVNATGCSGTCGPAKFWGPGLVPKCTAWQEHYDLLHDSTRLENGITIFYSSIGWDRDMPGQFSIQAVYKPDAAYIGNKTHRSCTLQLAKVGYQVIIDGTKGTISLDPATTIDDDESAGSVDVPLPIEGQSTPIGGLYYALGNIYAGESILETGNALGPKLTPSGSAVRYANLRNRHQDGPEITFRDPTDDIFATARELMFRLAIASANSSTVQSGTMNQKTTEIVFKAEPLWYILAVLATLIGVSAVAVTSLGYHKLGRPISMSPVEIAKAFGPALLNSTDSNCTIDSLLKEVGARKVRYGALRSENCSGKNKSTSSTEKIEKEHDGTGPRSVLVISAADDVDAPQTGQTFSGKAIGAKAKKSDFAQRRSELTVPGSQPVSRSDHSPPKRRSTSPGSLNVS